MLLSFVFKNSAALVPNGVALFHLQEIPPPGSAPDPHTVHLHPLLPPPAAIWDARIPGRLRSASFPSRLASPSICQTLQDISFSSFHSSNSSAGTLMIHEKVQNMRQSREPWKPCSVPAELLRSLPHLEFHFLAKDPIPWELQVRQVIQGYLQGPPVRRAGCSK